LGDNTNFYVMANFLLLAGGGGLAGGLTAGERRWSGMLARRLRSLSIQSHIFLFWPLIVLLGFHILSMYYY
jgi:nitrite reductase (NADH) large subunit